MPQASATCEEYARSAKEAEELPVDDFGRVSLDLSVLVAELVRGMKRSPAQAPFSDFFAFFGVPVPVRVQSDVIRSSLNGEAFLRPDLGLALRGPWGRLTFLGVRGLLLKARE